MKLQNLNQDSGDIYKNGPNRSLLERSNEAPPAIRFIVLTEVSRLYGEIGDGRRFPPCR